MPQFMDVHDGFYGVSQQDVEGAHHKDLEVEAAEGVHFTHWWADPASGKVFCLSEGPSKEAVMRVHAKAGHPTEQIYEVPLAGE
ncbi:MAG TPA: SCO4226 family nickel-binding protein [Dehalococcoidia bacterium]|nr:SCO4226 family nickel-binding protein [Dehalococcoidia bacterium]